MGNKPKELNPAAKEGRCRMAAKNTTPSRYAQMNAILEFAKEMGYTGHTDKLEIVAQQWAPKGANSEKRKENRAYAEKIWRWMQPGEEYCNENIRDGVPGLPVGSKGKVEPTQVSAIMNVGIVDGLFAKVEKSKRITFYVRVEGALSE